MAGEAAYLMKDGALGAVQPVAMPALKEMVDGRCSVARAVAEEDLKGKNAQFIDPKVFAERSPRPTKSRRSRHDAHPASCRHTQD